MIGIITVNWRGFDVTMDLVKHLVASDYSAFRVVVVNNSVEDNEKFAANPVHDDRVVIINSSENKGFSGGVNMGLRELLPEKSFTHFMIMNNDVALASDFLTKMFEAAKSTEKIYSPLIFFRDTDLIYNTGGKVHIWLGGTINLNNHVPADRVRKVIPDYFSGCVLFMHRSVVERTGLFDETFGTYYEDVDFCYRAQRIGISLEMVWDVFARHFHSYSTKGDNTYKIYLLNRNQVIFARKHLRCGAKLVFILAAVVRGLITNLGRKHFKPYFRGIKEGFSTTIDQTNDSGETKNG